MPVEKLLPLATAVEKNGRHHNRKASGWQHWRISGLFKKQALHGLNA